MIAGITKTLDDFVLETLFYQQVKSCRSISHDLQEYHRAEEGTPKKSYDFLVNAVRRYLERQRLEYNRDRLAHNLGAPSSSTATPALEGKGKYVPKGYCISWCKTGSCSRDNCTYKHETPPEKPGRPRSNTPKKTPRGRTQLRDRQTACKFWKAGRCKKGSSCRFKHEGNPSKSPRAATPARTPPPRKRSGSRSPGRGDRKRSGSRSPGRW